MRFFMLSMKLACKRTILNKGLWLTILLMAAALVFSAVPKGSVVEIHVGIVLDEENSFHQAVFDGLASGSPIVFHPLPAYTPELEAQVAKGALECVYILSGELEEQMSGRRPENAITLVKSPATIADSLVNELVFASILRQSALDITVDQLEKILVREDITADVEALYQQYAQGEDQDFVQTASTSMENPVIVSKSAPKRLEYGIIALGAMLGLVTLLPVHIGEKAILFGRLGAKKTLPYYLAVSLAHFVGILFMGLLGLVVLTATGMSPRSGTLIALTAYCAAMAMLGLVLLLALPEKSVLYTGGGFALLLTLFFGGIFLDWREIASGLAWVSRLFPSDAFINSSLSASTRQLWPLLVWLTICTITTLTLILARCLKKGD